MTIMDRLGVAPLVRNYHLFYCCVANSEPKIRKAVRDLGRFPSQKEIDRVIDEFCPEANESDTMRRHHISFLATLDEFVHRLGSEGVELSSFNDAIARVATTFSNPVSREKLTDEFLLKIATILGDAGNRRVLATRDFLKMLEANRNEVDSLRNELSELRKIANTDSLTSLANRRAFDDRLCYLMGQDEDFVLLLADLDHFKKINDAHGHPIGDDVLKSTALVLHRALGEHTFLARTGGEEFAVILPSVVPNDAFALAERLRLSVQANRIKKNKDELAVTISIGLAHSQFFTASNDVYEAADIALYRSKNDGRNRVSVHALTEDRTAGARYRMYADSNEA